MRRALGPYVQATGPFPKRLDGNMVPPLALGQPLPASGLCRGPCSDAPPTSLSKPTTTGLSPGLERLILMRIDARIGAIPAPG